jgi:hypothetical protein
MLVELLVVEQQHKAVLEALGGRPVTQVALRYVLARQIVHEWLRRYGGAGIGRLWDHSPGPMPSG